MNPIIYAGLEPGLRAFAICKLVPDFIPSSKEERIEASLQSLSEIYGVKASDIRNPPDRRMMFVEPRGMMFFYLRISGYTYNEIAKEFRRNHSSIIHACKNMRTRLLFKNAPERVGFIQLLHELGHIPSVLINTCAGSLFINELIDNKDYTAFFELDMNRYQQIVSKYNSDTLKARLKGDTPNAVSTYYRLIQEKPLHNIYSRKPKHASI